MTHLKGKGQKGGKKATTKPQPKAPAAPKMPSNVFGAGDEFGNILTNPAWDGRANEQHAEGVGATVIPAQGNNQNETSTPKEGDSVVKENQNLAPSSGWKVKALGALRALKSAAMKPTSTVPYVGNKLPKTVGDLPVVVTGTIAVAGATGLGLLVRWGVRKLRGSK